MTEWLHNEFLGVTLGRYATALGIILIAFIAKKIFAFFFIKAIVPLARKTRHDLDDLFLTCLRKPLEFLIFLAGTPLLAVQDQFAIIPAPYADAMEGAGTASLSGLGALLLNPANLTSADLRKLELSTAHSSHFGGAIYEFISGAFQFRHNLGIGWGLGYFNGGDIPKIADRGRHQKERSGVGRIVFSCVIHNYFVREEHTLPVRDIQVKINHIYITFQIGRIDRRSRAVYIVFINRDH